MNKDAHLISEAYNSGVKKMYAVTYRHGQNKPTRICNNWEEAKRWVTEVIANGEEVISIHEVGAKVKIPDVKAEVAQLQKERMGPSFEDMMSGRYQ